jgi:hypothetical protein
MARNALRLGLQIACGGKPLYKYVLKGESNWRFFNDKGFVHQVA